MQTNPWVTPELLSCLVQLKLSRVIFYHYHLKKKTINTSVMETLAKGITTQGSLLLVLFFPFTLQNLQINTGLAWSVLFDRLVDLFFTTTSMSKFACCP